MKGRLDNFLHLLNEQDRMEEDELELLPIEVTPHYMCELLEVPKPKRFRKANQQMYTTRQLLGLLNIAVVELANDVTGVPPEAFLRQLNMLPRKHLQFHDTFRPPYYGTFTRMPPQNSALRKGKNPFEKSLPHTDYDYDSASEWVAPEEGEEEILSETGDDEDEDGEDEDEMAEFLDDEEDAGRGRPPIDALVVYNSGLSWEDEKGKNKRPEFNKMKMDVLLSMSIST